ncbi:MAG: hypothetical protein CHACPFDD_02171 [Phycisphaerae bacterium]|nr:hypothetical protein [Phycisphaerae bacterium]
MKHEVYENDAAEWHLRSADARLAALIDRIGPCQIRFTPDPFSALVSSIVHQQLSMKAAATIGRRLRALCPRGRLSPRALSRVADPALRGAGLSERKVSYLRDVCAHFGTRRVTAARLRSMPDEDVVAAVTQIHGIGRWTAEMLLLFCLKRPDVWPVDDLGLQKALQKLHAARRPLPRTRLERAGEPFRPFRSRATWYLWRSLDGPLPPGLEPPAANRPEGAP